MGALVNAVWNCWRAFLAEGLQVRYLSFLSMDIEGWAVKLTSQLKLQEKNSACQGVGQFFCKKKILQVKVLASYSIHFSLDHGDPI